MMFIKTFENKIWLKAFFCQGYRQWKLYKVGGKWFNGASVSRRIAQVVGGFSFVYAKGGRVRKGIWRKVTAMRRRR